MILREERIGGQRLLLGDSLAILPTLGPFDAMVTDPPYGIGDIMVGSGRFAGMCKRMGGEEGWDKEPPPKWVFENEYPTIAWGGNYLGLPPSRGWLAWVKNNAAPTFAAIEFAWTNMDFNAKHWIGPVGCPQDEKAGHPTQKPLALMVWCLGFVPKAKSIIDPFAGSGTTAVACHRVGKHCTAIERDPDYFAAMCKRVDEAARQPDLLIPETRPQPVQEGLDL